MVGLSTDTSGWLDGDAVFLCSCYVRWVSQRLFTYGQEVRMHYMCPFE